jgi:hypothetical protein
MIYRSCFNSMTIFKFLFTTYVQYNFYMRMSWVTILHFAKYFCDICSEYVTPCTVMTYGTSDAIWVMPARLRTLCSHAMVWSA